MRPDQVLIPIPSDEKGTVIIAGMGTDTISFLGSSLPEKVSARPGERLDFLSVSPPEGESVIVAVSVHTHRWDKRFGNTVHFFIEVGWQEGRPWAFLKDPWVPLADRLGQIVGDILQVRVGDGWFTSSEDKATREGLCYVPDADLLCQYMAGKVGPEKVEAAAIAKQEEESGETVETLQKEVDRLREVLDEKSKRVQRWENCARGLMKALRTRGILARRREIRKVIDSFPYYR